MPPKSAKKKTVSAPKPKKDAPAPEDGAAVEATQGAQSTTDSLLGALISGTAVASTVDVIMTMYREEDADGALCAVINAVCKSSGVQDVEIDAAMLHQEGNIVSTLEELFARVPADSAAYYLVNKDPKYKRFRKTFPDFFERLVVVAYAADVLLDNVLFTTLLQWIIAMTESKARSFRHTSTVAILGIMQGLNDRISFLKESIQSLKKKEATASQKKLDNLLQLQDHIFTSAVHQRVKDVAPEIRLAVLQSLKQLCLMAPDLYVTNKYLRYFSIALYDKKPELRAEGLEAIIQIIGNHPTAAPRMRDFLKYFAERLVEMVNDVDSRCADLAIKVNALIIRSDSEAGESEESATLSNDMIDKILLALFDDRPGIRNSAGTFLKVFIRCRVGDDENANQVRTELLCTFASIFRNSYRQEQPEKYLVDALWRAENPPAILTEYKPILELAVKGEECDATVALGIIAALLGRLHEPLQFGPAPKDDIKQSSKTDAAKEADAKALRVKLSKDVGVLLHNILEKHSNSIPIVSAVADVFSAMDLHVFTTSKENERITQAFSTFRKAVSGLPIVESNAIQKCTAGWYAIAFTEFPQQDAAKVQLNEFVKQSLNQLQAADRQSRSSQELSQSSKRLLELEQVWARMQVLSALIPLKDQWILLKNAFKRYAASKNAPLLISKLVPIAAQGVLWQRAELEMDPSLNPDGVYSETTEVVEQLLDIALWENEGTRYEPGVLEARVEALSYFSDLVSLPQTKLSQLHQESYLECAAELFDAIQGELKECSDTLRDNVKQAQSAEAAMIASVIASRSSVSKWEAALARVATGIARLFAFQKLPDKLGPQALLLWTRCHVKPVADIFKALFHTIRDRSDAFSLEKEIRLAAYKQCAEQGSAGAAVEALYQVGLKLSSMHFVPTDKYYPVCLAIVRFGVDFAATVDPTMLNAISPFCARLKQSDALAVVNSLHHHEVFVAATSTYAQAFVSAIRRAAKLEDVAASAAPSATPWRASKKRARETTLQSQEQVADELLAEVTRSVSRRPLPTEQASPKVPVAPKSANGKKGQAPAPTRNVTADGWRVRAEDEQLLSQASAVGMRSPAIPGTQDSAALSTMLAELDQEVMIATQEFE